MKKTLFSLVFVGAVLASTKSFAQTTLQGRPATFDGTTIRCGMENGECATIGGGGTTTARSQDVPVTVFTADGPVTFTVAPDYQIIGSPRGSGAAVIVEKKEEAIEQ